MDLFEKKLTQDEEEPEIEMIDWTYDFFKDTVQALKTLTEEENRAQLKEGARLLLHFESELKKNNRTQDEFLKNSPGQVKTRYKNKNWPLFLKLMKWAGVDTKVFDIEFRRGFNPEGEIAATGQWPKLTADKLTRNKERREKFRRDDLEKGERDPPSWMTAYMRRRLEANFDKLIEKEKGAVRIVPKSVVTGSSRRVTCAFGVNQGTIEEELPDGEQVWSKLRTILDYRWSENIDIWSTEKLQLPTHRAIIQLISDFQTLGPPSIWKFSKKEVTFQINRERDLVKELEALIVKEVRPVDSGGRYLGAVDIGIAKVDFSGYFHQFVFTEYLPLMFWRESCEKWEYAESCLCHFGSLSSIFNSMRVTLSLQNILRKFGIVAPIYIDDTIPISRVTLIRQTKALVELVFSCIGLTLSVGEDKEGLLDKMQEALVILGLAYELIDDGITIGLPEGKRLKGLVRMRVLIDNVNSGTSSEEEFEKVIGWAAWYMYNRDFRFGVEILLGLGKLRKGPFFRKAVSTPLSRACVVQSIQQLIGFFENWLPILVPKCVKRRPEMHIYSDASLEGGVIVLGMVNPRTKIAWKCMLDEKKIKRWSWLRTALLSYYQLKGSIGIWEALAGDLAQRLFLHEVVGTNVFHHMDNTSDIYAFVNGVGGGVITSCIIAAVVSRDATRARERFEAGEIHLTNKKTYLYVNTVWNIADLPTRSGRLEILEKMGYEVREVPLWKLDEVMDSYEQVYRQIKHLLDK